MPFNISVEIKDESILAILEAIQERLGNQRPAMTIIGETIRTSIVRNFEVGGRPKPWKASKRVDREKESKRVGMTLVDTARLKNSFTVEASK